MQRNGASKTWARRLFAYLNHPLPISRNNPFMEEAEYSQYPYKGCGPPLQLSQHIDETFIDYSDGSPRVSSSESNTMLFNNGKTRKLDHEHDTLHFQQRRSGHSLDHRRELGYLCENTKLPSCGDKEYSFAPELSMAPRYECSSTIEAPPNSDLLSWQQFEPSSLEDDHDSVDFLQLDSSSSHDSSKYILPYNLGNGQRTVSAPELTRSPILWIHNTIKLPEQALTLVPNPRIACNGDGIMLTQSPRVTPRRYRLQTSRLTSESDDDASAGSHSSFFPKLSLSLAFERNADPQHGSQEPSPIACSRIICHPTLQTSYQQLSFGACQDQGAGERRKPLDMPPSLTLSLNILSSHNKVSVEDCMTSQAEMQRFMRSTSAGSSSTTIHLSTSSFATHLTSENQTVTDFPTDIETSTISPQLNITPSVTPQRVQTIQTSLPITSIPLFTTPHRYQVYNDTLPSSIQPQTPDQLPEARHQSRYHPSYIAPVGNSSPTRHPLLDNIRSRTLSSHSESPSLRDTNRDRSRRASPAGLLDEGYRGLYGGRENALD
ncbi:hypothetical protein B7463_g1815, partial [Scytalidium lignicola]